MTPPELAVRTLPHDRSRRAALLAVAAAVLLPMVWLGDIPFINDEPMLIANALDANQSGRLAPFGLVGTYGFTYGPLPTWIYQLLMPLSHNLVVIAAFHTCLLAVTTAGALWWMSRSLGLWVWFTPVPLLSPYFVFYSRVLWDNPLLLPLGALAIAGYAAHLQSGSPAGLRVSIAAAVGTILVHLMATALVMPLAMHMLIVRWRALLAHARSIAVIGLAWLLLAWPYWTRLASQRPASSGFAFAPDGWSFPLFGGRLLSACELDYFYGPGPAGGALLEAASALSWVAYALVWGGIVVAIADVVRSARSRTWTPRAHVAAIALGMLVCQSIVSGLSAKTDHPHYYNGTWVSFVVLAWLAVNHLASLRQTLRWSASAAVGLLAATLLVTDATLAYRLHRNGGTREAYGATLANQQAVARALSRYDPATDVQLHVSMYERYPHTLATLRRLNPGAPPRLAARELHIRYRSANPATGFIVLSED